MQPDDAWAREVYRALGGRYHNSLRRQHPEWKTDASSGGSEQQASSNNDGTTTTLSGCSIAMDATAAYPSLLDLGGDGAPLDYSCMEPRVMGNPTSAPSTLADDAHASLAAHQDDAMEGWYPMCFYAQMLSTTEPHRSVSHPNSPRNATSAKGGSRALDEAADARHWKSRLLAHARTTQSQNLQGNLELQLFSGVEERATACAAEMQEMIDYVRRLNRATCEAQRQLNISRAIDVPRETGPT